MYHTIITIDVASYGKLDTTEAGVLAGALNETVWEWDARVNAEVDEWKVLVVQQLPNGERSPVPGWRQA